MANFSEIYASRDQRVLTVNEVSAILRVGKQVIYRMAKDGQLRAVRPGGRIRIPSDALEDFLAGRSEDDASIRSGDFSNQEQAAVA
jgi:excisionase family DNA binding protein